MTYVCVVLKMDLREEKQKQVTDKETVATIPVEMMVARTGEGTGPQGPSPELRTQGKGRAAARWCPGHSRSLGKRRESATTR